VSSTSIGKTFVVVARAASGAYFMPDGYFRARQYPTKAGPVEVLIRTHRENLLDFDRPVPRGLFAEVRGGAESIYQALNEFTTAAQNLTPLIALSANAPIKNMQPELAFETTEGITRREYFQQFLLPERFYPYRPRIVNGPATRDLLLSVTASPHSERLLRAAAQYFHALQEWGPGQEIMALVHLYIAVEVLTPVALREYLAQYRIEKEQLAESWGVDINQLDSEVRRRLIFEGDGDTYLKVRKASDGFEHGFLDFHTIHATALDLRENTARYVRRAILKLARVPDGTIETLSKHPYAKPFQLEYTKYLWGSLLGEGSLARDDQLYPFVLWRSKASQKPWTDGPDPEIKFEETFTMKLGDGITFEPRRIEVWGARPDDDPDPPTISGA